MLLNKAETERVEAAIAGIEQRSAAEVVVCVIRRAEGYAYQRACFALLVSVLGAWAAALAFPLWAVAWLFWGQVPLWLVVYWLAQWPPLLRLLVPANVRAAAVHARASQLFIERGVTETRERSGVLIVLAETERQVRLMGDIGIHAKLGDEGWREQLAPLLLALQHGQVAAGLVGTLQALGALLAEHFPVQPGDVNELPDTVLREP